MRWPKNKFFVKHLSAYIAPLNQSRGLYISFRLFIVLVNYLNLNSFISILLKFEVRLILKWVWQDDHCNRPKNTFLFLLSKQKQCKQ